MYYMRPFIFFASQYSNNTYWGRIRTTVNGKLKVELIWMCYIFQVVFRPLLSHTGIQSQDTVPLCYRMYFGEHLSFSGTLDCLRADIVDSDTAKERKGKRARRCLVLLSYLCKTLYKDYNTCFLTLLSSITEKVIWYLSEKVISI